MEKRVIWFALIIILAVSAIFIFRNGCKKKSAGALVKPSFSVKERDILVGDSIYYEDHTEGATSWFWDFGDGGSSIDEKGYNTYMEAGIFTVKLTVNGVATDSLEVVVNEKNVTPEDKITPKPVVKGPTVVYVGEPATFTDETPGAQHTDWQNMVTAEVKRDSKTYTTTFTRKGGFTIIATNDVSKGSNGQGIITGKILERPAPPAPKAAPAPAPQKAPAPAAAKPTPPPPPPPAGKQDPSNEQLRVLFNNIVTQNGDFSEKYAPIKSKLKDESLVVLIKNSGIQKKLYGFCQFLNMTKAKVLDVKAAWDPIDGFTRIVVTTNE